MEQPIEGIDRVLMFRLKENADKENAKRLALQTTHTVKESAKVATTATKDGTIVAPGTLTTTIEIEALGSDTVVNDMLHYAAKQQKVVEVWEIDFSKPAGDNQYMAQYGYGYLSDWETPAKVGTDATIKTTLTLNGQLVKGKATVSAQDAATVNNFFRDTIQGSKDTAAIPDYVAGETSTGTVSGSTASGSQPAASSTASGSGSSH